MFRWIIEHFGYRLESRLAAHDATPDADVIAGTLSVKQLIAQRAAWRAVYADYVRFDRRLKYNIITISLTGLGTGTALYEACAWLVPGIGTFEPIAAASGAVGSIGVLVTCVGLAWGLVNYRRRQQVIEMKRRSTEVLEAIDTVLISRAR